ncbi:MAG: hypothetical protein RL211_1446 [Pseudomonadota bacterium]|jgi:hypothetical protein
MICFFRLLPVFFYLLLAGCAGVATNVSSGDEGDGARAALTTSIPWVQAAPVLPVSSAAVAPVEWHHTAFPGKKASRYNVVKLDGRNAMAVQAHSSASMLRHKLRVEPADLHQLRFSWKVPALIEAADLTRRDLGDSPVRIVLAFEGDRARFSPRNAMLSELAHALTGEPLPYATLMYVWCNDREPGSVIINPRTDRIRKLVMESGPGNLGQWLDYERDIRADFEKAFGEAPGALLAVGIMTDSDNTQSTTQAWYGPVRLVPPGQVASVLLKQ